MLLWWLLLSVTVQASIFVVEQASSTQEASVRFLSSTSGDTISTSDLSFKYPAPLVESTVNPATGEFYVITYPTDSKGAVLFQLDSQLSLKKRWDNISFQFFDLQYSSKQNTLYGIFVSSRYGRVLSNFTTSDPLRVQQLFTLPYMWYVNASSFDQRTSTYFALLNNFPGQPNSTSDQKLVIANFAKFPPAISIFPLVIDGLATEENSNGDPIFKFLSWSEKSDQLYGLALAKNKAMLAAIDTDSGSSELMTTFDGVVDIGPSFVNSQDFFCSFLTRSDSTKILVCWDLSSINIKVIAKYDQSDLIFGAATFYNDGK